MEIKKDEHRGLELTEWDIKNINDAIRQYDKANPRGKYRYMDYEETVLDPLTKTEKKVKRRLIELLNIDDYLTHVRSRMKQEAGFKNLKTKSFDEPLRLTASLPPGLVQKLSKGYPTLLTDKKQTAKFLKAFPKFKLD